MGQSQRATRKCVSLTDEQRQELDRRLDDLEHSGAKGIPWEEVLEQIRNRPR